MHSPSVETIAFKRPLVTLVFCLLTREPKETEQAPPTADGPDTPEETLTLQTSNAFVSNIMAAS